MKVRGSKMILSEGPRRWDHWKIRGCLLGEEICHSITAFFGFSQKVEKGPFCFANFSLKTALTDKMEYSTMKPMKNTSKLSSQIFDFRNFVTEIFASKFTEIQIAKHLENCQNRGRVLLHSGNFFRFKIKINNCILVTHLSF